MLLKILHIVLLASVKYIVTLPYAMIIGVDYKYAILAVLAGGIGGFLFFYYLSKPVMRCANYLWPCLCNIIPSVIRKHYNVYCQHRNAKPRKVFSKQNRFFVRFKKTYGFWGIIIATPAILTIPVGAFLVSRFYAHKKHIVLYMILSIVGWGIILSGLVHLFPKVFL